MEPERLDIAESSPSVLAWKLNVGPIAIVSAHNLQEYQDFSTQPSYSFEFFYLTLVLIM